jgi:hypothetical protein
MFCPALTYACGTGISKIKFATFHGNLEATQTCLDPIVRLPCQRPFY